jgi:chromosome segregation ATPase
MSNRLNLATASRDELADLVRRQNAKLKELQRLPDAVDELEQRVASLTEQAGLVKEQLAEERAHRRQDAAALQEQLQMLSAKAAGDEETIALLLRQLEDAHTAAASTADAGAGAAPCAAADEAEDGVAANAVVALLTNSVARLEREAAAATLREASLQEELRRAEVCGAAPASCSDCKLLGNTLDDVQRSMSDKEKLCDDARAEAWAATRRARDVEERCRALADHVSSLEQEVASLDEAARRSAESFNTFKADVANGTTTPQLGITSTAAAAQQRPSSSQHHGSDSGSSSHTLQSLGTAQSADSVPAAAAPSQAGRIIMMQHDRHGGASGATPSRPAKKSSGMSLFGGGEKTADLKHRIAELEGDVAKRIDFDAARQRREDEVEKNRADVFQSMSAALAEAQQQAQRYQAQLQIDAVAAPAVDVGCDAAAVDSAAAEVGDAATPLASELEAVRGELSALKTTRSARIDAAIQKMQTVRAASAAATAAAEGARAAAEHELRLVAQERDELREQLRIAASGDADNGSSRTVAARAAAGREMHTAAMQHIDALLQEQ